MKSVSGSKKCSGCAAVKSVEEFNKNRSQPDGLHNQCKECRSTYSKFQYAEVAESQRSKSREYYRKNKDRKNAASREWYQANRDRVKELDRARYEAAPEYFYANAAKRRAAKIQRTPAWQDPIELEAYYAFRPDGYHVDHDIPLRGEKVSGLHVLGNLRYLTKEENLQKRNKFTPYIEVRATGQRVYLEE